MPIGSVETTKQEKIQIKAYIVEQASFEITPENKQSPEDQLQLDPEIQTTSLVIMDSVEEPSQIQQEIELPAK